MAIRIDRVYTRTGDQGTTGLVGGSRISKDDLRIEAYGTVDELNAQIGLCRAFGRILHGPKELSEEIESTLAAIQQDLFDMGADLATPALGPDSKKTPKARLRSERVSALEAEMDHWQEQLQPLTSFVLPGGSPVPAFLHAARTVCRRAERCTVRLTHREPILSDAVTYLNRLSDHLFVLSRYVTKRLGEEEILWKV